MAQYSIFEDNMDRLEKKLNRIANKCKRFGCEFTYKEIGEEFRELEDFHGNKYTARFVVVEAEGNAVINGWHFIASVEHTEQGNIINRIGEIEIPERFYSSKAICEHCNSSRYRKNTFIVMNEESGEFKQVGKSCLNDFTNGMSAEGIAYYISLFDELIQGEVPVGGRPGKIYFETKTILQFVAETIKHFGYVKTQYDDNTASRALNYYFTTKGYRITRGQRKELIAEMIEVSFDEESPDTIQIVNDALVWIAAQEEKNNYIHNLKTVCNLEYVTIKNIGILASLFPTYYREINYQTERERRRAAELATEMNSEHVGNIGDRITFQVAYFKCLTSWESDWGITSVYKLVDTHGNVYTWKTSIFIGEEDDIEMIKGTVKEHKEYNGIKQTELTRCKIA